MRKLGDWLEAFIEYGHSGEAPDNILLWSGVSAIAGALGRKCWIDQLTFKWFPNMYVVIVAPPGVVAKTTAAEVSMRLLRKVDGVFFGPNFTTWQALVEAFEEAKQVVEYAPGEAVETSSLTIVSGEFGNLISTEDRQMMDLLNTLWDCGAVDKATKKDGVERVDHPFLNMIACTTPSWISGNFPAYMIDGGLVSRIIWVYADAKRECIAYPSNISEERQNEIKTMRRYLVDDLGAIARLEGQFRLTPDAIRWGTDWYREHCRAHEKGRDDSRLGGFHARKQGHIHKLAMVLSASRGGSLTITREDLQRAEKEVSSLESTLLQIFDRIGRSETSNVAERLADYILRSGDKGVSQEKAYFYIRGSIQGPREFDEMLKGLKKSGVLQVKVIGGKAMLTGLQPETGG
jgi:hypothetical protein